VGKLSSNWPVWLANFLRKLRDRAEELKVIQQRVSRGEKGLDSGLHSRV
jgi:hypothetical protein